MLSNKKKKEKSVLKSPTSYTIRVFLARENIRVAAWVSRDHARNIKCKNNVINYNHSNSSSCAIHSSQNGRSLLDDSRDLEIHTCAYI